MRFPIGFLRTSDDLDRLVEHVADQMGFELVESEATYDGTEQRRFMIAPKPSDVRTVQLTEEEVHGDRAEVKLLIEAKIKAAMMPDVPRE